jgi:phosphoglycerate dehydrogenase-like enzyme
MPTNAAFFGSGTAANIDYVYAQGRRARVGELADVYPVVITAENFAEHAAGLGHVAAIFSTWGMPCLTGAQLDRLPGLRAVFFAAGSVKGFAEPLLQRGIAVVSAVAANAVPVAEFTVAQIMLALKGYFRNTAAVADPTSYRTAPRGPGGYGARVALLGAGAVGRAVIERLRAYTLEVVVVDPTLTDADAAALGVTLVSLPEAFATAQVVSNHLPNLPALRGVLNGALLGTLRPDAVFINTGRGAQVVEADLIATLQARPDVTVLLDVTDPEPPAAGSPLYTLPNAHLSTHIAGSLGNEVVRMADLVIEEFLRWQAGAPLQHAVRLEQLPMLA